MRLTVLGSSGSGPTRTNPASGYLVQAGTTAVWLDAGTGTFMELARLIDPASLTAVVVSHVHVDHCADLFGLYGYLAYGPPAGEASLPVLVPTGAADHLAAFARADAGHVFRHVLDLTTVGPGSAVELGEVGLHFGAAVHGVPALVTRIEHGGTSLVYSGDTGPGGDLASLAHRADAALVEASLSGERSAASTPFHLTAGEAGSVASAAGVGDLIVTHLSPTLDPETAVDRASAAFGRPARSARPGEVHQVGPG